jgi:threonine dehydratase
MRVGEHTFSIVSELVDALVTIDDERIFDAVLWTMSRCKLVVEGAAAAPVAALLEGRVQAEPGAKVVCVLSGGNIDLEQLRGRVLN